MTAEYAALSAVFRCGPQHMKSEFDEYTHYESSNPQNDKQDMEESCDHGQSSSVVC